MIINFTNCSDLPFHSKTIYSFHLNITTLYIPAYFRGANIKISLAFLAI